MTIRILFFYFILNHLVVAQTVTFDDYKKKADACFKVQDYSCAKQNYERALRIRNDELYCKSQLQKTEKAPCTQDALPTSSKTKFNVEFLNILKAIRHFQGEYDRNKCRRAAMRL